MQIIKNDKLDKIFNTILVYSFALYIFCIHITESQIYFLPYVKDLSLNIPLLALAYLIIKIIYDLLRGRIDIKIILACILCSVLLFTVKYFSKGSVLSYFVIMLYIVGFKNADMDMSIKYIFFSLALAWILIVGLSLIGVIVNHPVAREDGVSIRYLLGYDWNNVAHNHFFSVVLFYMLYKKKLKIYDYIIICVLNIILYQATTSRCAFICVFLTILIYILINIPYLKIVDKIFGIVAIVAPFFISVLSIVSAYVYNPPKNINKLNNILKRLALGHRGIKKWGISLFGKPVDMSQGDNYSFIDCSYISILLNDGIIFLVLILGIYTVFAYYAYKTKNKILSIAIFMIIIHSMIEPWFTSLTNFPLIVLFLGFLAMQNNIKSA